MIAMDEDIEEIEPNAAETPYAVVATTVESVEAEVLRSVLDAEDIETTVLERNDEGISNSLWPMVHSTAYDIVVPAIEVEHANAVLEEYEHERGTISEGELAAAAESAYDPRV